MCCGCLFLGTRVLWGGTGMRLCPIRQVSSVVGSFPALWAVFGAPPADATNVGGVVIDTGVYFFAALVAMLLWCRRVVGHAVPCFCRCRCRLSESAVMPRSCAAISKGSVRMMWSRSWRCSALLLINWLRMRSAVVCPPMIPP